MNKNKTQSIDDIINNINEIIAKNKNKNTVNADNDINNDIENNCESELEDDNDDSIEVIELEETNEIAVSENPYIEEKIFNQAHHNMKFAFNERINGVFQIMNEKDGKKSSIDLEEIIIKILKPYLKEWLDNNLTAMVSDILIQEIKKKIN